MDLHLTVDPREQVRLFLNGQLACDIAVGVCDTPGTLEAEVHAARCLRALAGQVQRLGGALTQALEHPDHAHRARQAQDAALLRGLVAGLAGETTPHPTGPFVPPVLPESSRTYARGYVLGEALMHAARGGQGEAQG